MEITPKFDMLSEQSIIGCMLLDKEVIPYVLTNIKDKYFYDENNGIIFKAIQSLVSKGSEVDLVLLKNSLEAQDIQITLNNGKQIIDKFKKENLLHQIGGMTYLAELVEAVNSTGNIKDYCKIVKENYILREYKKLSSFILNGLNNNLDISGISGIIEKQLKIINSLGIDDKIEDMFTIMTDHYNSLLNSLEGSDLDIKRTKTGLKDLDKMISMHGGDLIVIAASSSIGKSLTAINILNNITKAKKRGLLFTMEMNKNKITDILLTINSDIKYQTLQTWNDEILSLRSKLLMAKDRLEDGTDKDDSYIKIIQEELDQLIEKKQQLLMDNMNYIDEISKRELYIDDRSGTSIEIIKNKIMELSISKGLDLVVIDQLSLMSGPGKGIRERYDIITGELKQLAREYNVPIILIVQLLGKELGKRPGHVPRNDDIKESFKIYEDADVVLLLNRPLFWNREDGIPIDDFTDKSMHVYISKNRGGNTGKVILGCDITKQKLYDATKLEKSLVEY